MTMIFDEQTDPFTARLYALEKICRRPPSRPACSPTLGAHEQPGGADLSGTSSIPRRARRWSSRRSRTGSSRSAGRKCPAWPTSRASAATVKQFQVLAQPGGARQLRPRHRERRAGALGQQPERGRRLHRPRRPDLQYPRRRQRDHRRRISRTSSSPRRAGTPVRVKNVGAGGDRARRRGWARSPCPSICPDGSRRRAATTSSRASCCRARASRTKPCSRASTRSSRSSTRSSCPRTSRSSPISTART